MADITIIEAEEKVTKTGKKLKKLHLLVEGKQYPYKGVTAWEDSAPDYDKLAGGYKLQADLFEKEGTNTNPHTGKPYKERTLYPLKNDNGTQAVLPTEAISLINGRLQKLEEKVFGQAQPQPVEAKEDEIDPDDIPF